ncbi:hypothetical protein [Gordonia soli]|uniref:Uncharacterized protein n=1 Tax=Gordonia soli NBRC 108243 TaxID=1223545 RepID=M0QI11_9ACTN|nr:hypothetical protein [Gordonia soli]GAC67921.1 hypothetical protein GS4_11_01900 [Gordonia soli NBRC 108243]
MSCAPRWPLIGLIVVGAILVIAPIAGGFFYPAAQATVMLDDFRPYLAPEKIADLRGQLDQVESARGAIVAIDRVGAVDADRYPQIRDFVDRYPAIRADMSAMLDQIDSARGDFTQLDGLQPVDVLPFIPVGFGLVLIGAGAWGLRRRRRGRSVRWLGVGAGVAAAALIAVPFATGMTTAVDAGSPLLARFSTLMTTEKVRDVQGYFVVLVGAVGSIDSSYRDDVTTAGARADRGDVAAIDTLRTGWQPMSSDFAALIGTLNDNVTNYDGVRDLDDSTRAVGVGAFAAFPWFLVGGGAVALLFGLAAARPSPTTRAVDSGSRSTRKASLP